MGLTENDDMIQEEGPPSLAGWSSPLDHLLGDARLRDLKPELEKFAVDARRTPKRCYGAATRGCGTIVAV